ncbi:Fc.00g030740.m01.CDS01 [Cosmosporella sp. VM-42]
MARSARPQRIVLAISGGVDSMAMAFLFSRLLRTFRGYKIADNPSYGAHAIVIDHQLREGSGLEAAQVAKELRRLELKSTVVPLGWKEARKNGLDPKTLPNLEGLARTYRYRALGNSCQYLGASSVFFAHHRDDQYETVLMRLLGGHGYRGLQGIRKANSIPECYDMHGVYKSGLIDDQLRAQPFLSFKPAIREMRRLRSIFRDEKLSETDDSYHLGSDQFVDRFPRLPQHIERDNRVPYLKPLDSEDGGVMIYRPLMEFDKDRLIATCEANKIEWFEDHTNLDPTLTTRNAVRHLIRNHELPKALQKPSILALAERSRRRTNYEEAEAHRFLIREGIIRDFDPNAGTLLVQLPIFRGVKEARKRPSMRVSNETRREHLKQIVTIAVRKLIDFVTPEIHLPPLNSLDNVVYRLFPDLAPEPNYSPPKSFAMSGVLFTPVENGKSLKWFLARTPYPSNQPLPSARMYTLNDNKVRPPVNHQDEYSDMIHQNRVLSWKKAKIFDGRFWIRVGHNNMSHFQVQPFRPEHAKSFRKALTPGRRARLEKLLKLYAPGKVRYSLPALYCVERERDHYSQHVTTTLTMLALPTLGIHVPGLERWVRYEARYKKIDTSLLGHRPRGEQGPLLGYYRVYSALRRKRRRRMYKYLERRRNV